MQPTPFVWVFGWEVVIYAMERYRGYSLSRNLGIDLSVGLGLGQNQGMNLSLGLGLGLDLGLIQ